MAKDPNAPKTPMPMSIDAVADVCWGAGFRGQGLEDALAVICAEHGGPTSIDAHDSLLNNNRAVSKGPSLGSSDRGLLMINDYWHSEVSDTVAYDPAGAAREGYRISKGGTVWKEWSTWPGLANRHRTAARQAAERRAVRGGTGSLGGTGIPQTNLSNGAVSPGGVFSSDIIIPAGQVGAAVVRPHPPTGFLIDGARRDLDELVVGGNVDLTLDEASQIAVEFLVPGAGADPFLVPVAAKFRWGPFGAQAPFRCSGVQADPGAGGYKVTLNARPHGLHLMRRPHDDPAQSYAPSFTEISPTEYVRELVARRGFAMLGQGSALRQQIAPAKIDESRMETEWEVATRLSDDLGYMLFESDGVVHFGTPEWLTARATEVKVGWSLGWGNADLDALDRPSYRLSEDNTRDEVVTVSLPRWRGELVRPGMRMRIRGMGGYEPETGWLVSRVNWAIDSGNSPVTVEAFRPDNLLRPAKTETDTYGGPPSGGSAAPTGPGTKSSLDFVTLCLAQAGDRYVFGAEANINDQDPDTFDCSELIQWAAGRVGVAITDGTWLQYRAILAAKLTRTIAEAGNIRGALLFKFSSDPTRGGRPSIAHVAISLGDGQRTIEAQNPAKGVLIGNYAGRGWTHAGLIPGLDYGIKATVNVPTVRLW